jgi:hypothetical protein
VKVGVEVKEVELLVGDRVDDEVLVQGSMAPVKGFLVRRVRGGP